MLPYIEPDVFLPTYSLVCKRASDLEALLPKLSSKRPKVVLLDDTGIKVFGEGEWKVKMHEASKRRKWVKLHIALMKILKKLSILKSQKAMKLIAK